MIKKYVSRFFLCVSTVMLSYSYPATAVVVVNDAKDLIELGRAVANEGKELATAVNTLKNSTLELIDLGDYMDIVFNLDFLSPKPALSSDVVDAVPKNEQANTTPKLPTTGSDAEGGKFPNHAASEQSVKNNMQVREETPADDPVGQVTSMITGGQNSIKTEEITRRHARLAQSKQAFARYALATALVHRTLAYRTLHETKDDTQEKVNATNTIRKTHETKVYGNMRMAETYNRLLMSQAAANGLNAFTVMDDVESKPTFDLLNK